MAVGAVESKFQKEFFKSNFKKKYNIIFTNFIIFLALQLNIKLEDLVTNTELIIKQIEEIFLSKTQLEWTNIFKGF